MVDSQPSNSGRFLWNGKWREISAAKGDITEVAPGHLLVASADGLFEAFMLPDGSLSDGSVLDGVSLTLESDRERIIRDRFQSQEVSGTNEAGSVVIRSPMPGLVRAVNVSPGDHVERSSTVLVLEAMKMENNILAGSNGRVKRVLVEPGTSVEKNASLIEIELH